MSIKNLDTIDLVMADDHEIFRDGFRLMLGKAENIRLVGEAANGRELLEMVKQLQPRVVITDIKMPIMDGIEATRKIKQQYPEVGVIGLSMFDEEDLVMDMLEAGALGYLVKNADKEEVVAAIKAVNNQEHYYCRQTSNKLAFMIARSRQQASRKREQVEFSEKELDIIKLICQELTNKEIADRLFLSVRTVEGYRLKLLEKIQVKNSIGLVIYAIQNGIFEPGR